VAESLVPSITHPVVVAVCLVPARRAVALRLLGEVARSGGTAILVTADGSRTSGLPAGVELVDLSTAERRVGLHALVTRSPARVVRRLLGRPAAGPSWAWRRWSSSRTYRAIRPWVLWRSLRAQVSKVGLDQLDHVVIVSIESWPITWQLLQRNPQATYGWDVPDAVYDRTGATRTIGTTA
jgi:hypothetical protein